MLGLSLRAQVTIELLSESVASSVAGFGPDENTIDRPDAQGKIRCGASEREIFGEEESCQLE